MMGASSISTVENSTASITLDKVRLYGGNVTAHSIILKDVVATDNDEATLTSANKLQVQGDISLKKSKASAGQTVIDAGKSLTLGTGAFTTGAVTIETGAALTLGTTTNLNGIITNNGTLKLGGTITVDLTAFTAGSRERYSAGDNGYKTIDTTYAVLTGNAATGSASWKVGSKSATYDNGVVILAGVQDKSVYHVRNGDVDYTQNLAQPNAVFSLEGGHLQLNESLLGTQSIVSKNSNSLVCLKNSQVELKSSQISLDGAEYVTLQAPDAGTYVIDKAVGGIVELTLGTGVKLAEGNWWGTVKTTGNTTVNSNVDTSSWINTELNGTTTVNNGASLTLGNNTRLNGKIVNNGTLVLGGKIDVDSSSVVHTSKNTYASTGDANDLGTESGSGFVTTLNVYSVVDGTAATGSASWTVGGQAAHYDSGKVSLLTNKDTATWWMNSDATYSEVVGNFEADTSTLALNTEDGTLKLNATPDVKLVSKKSATVEIGSDVNLNAGQLDASAAGVTLSGKGSYTLGAGDNALNTGVSLSEADWRGTVNTTGDSSALELDALGVSGSKVELGSNDHTLAAQDQSVAADLKSTGSISLEDHKLTLSGDNELGSLNVGSLEIAGGSTTISDGLTTGGESSVATGAALNIGGDSTLGGKITNEGALVLSGNITIDTSAFADVLTINPHFQQGSSAESTSSGFMSSDGMEIQVVTGNAANASGAIWSVSGVSNGSYAFDEESGRLYVVTDKDSVGTSFYINMGDTITYDKDSAIFTNINGERATELVLNGSSKLVLSTELHEETTQIRAQEAGSVDIGANVNLNASQLAASDTAAVSLSGGGSYTMVAGANTLGAGVSVGTGWTGTVKVSGGADALDISSLGVRGSKIHLSAGVYELSAGDHTIDAQVGAYGEASLKMSGGALKFTDNAFLYGVEGASSITATKFADIRVFATTDALAGNIQVADGTLKEMTDGAEISTSGTVKLRDITLGAVLNNSGSLTFSGDMVLDTAQLGTQPETENWYNASNAAGEPGSTSGSGFRTIQDIYTVVTGQAAENLATWKVDDREAEYADGKVLAFREKDLTTYWVNTNTEVSLDTADDEFIAGTTTTIALNGGKLVMDTNTELALKSHDVSVVEIGEGVGLNAGQLDASAAGVTLTGGGIYDMQGQKLSGVLQLGAGVTQDAGEWQGTVYTGSTEQGAALDITALGNSQSTVHVGVRPMLRATPAETVLESLNAAGVGTTETPGSLALQKGSSKAETLLVHGILTLGSADAAASLEADSVTLQGLHFAHADSGLKADKLVLEGSTTLNVQLTDEVLSNKDAGEPLTLLTLGESFNVEEVSLTFNGNAETERVRSGDNRKEYTLAWNEDGTVLTLSILGTETYVTEQVAPTTGNGRAAVALMTEVFLNSRPQKEAPDGALAGILNAVDAGTATDRDMAAVAGASTAALGMALSGDVERQLSAIRNRSVAGNDAGTVTFVDEKSGMLAVAPARFFAWVNAEGNRAEQDADSTAAGYTLTSWGGTLGAGMQVNDKLTLGLALTAMYGDLQSDGPDSLKGDMDTTYVSAFARYNAGAWSHAFIGTVGSMEADYKRSVSHAAGSYSTAGDTDGTALGLMYEVSREMQLNNSSTVSPVFNIAYRHTEVEGYSESVADAALNVGKQSMDTVTAGAGARYAAVVGQQTLNRACGFEARALVKYDLGDRQSTTSTGFINRTTRAGIESAEMGAFGVELGAGISVPVRTGSIFADAAVELRSDYTNMNGTVGYRVQF